MLDVALLILACATNVLLGVVVLTNRPTARRNLLFATMTFLFAAWSIVSFLEDTPLSYPVVYALVQWDFVLAALTFLVLFWFCADMSCVRAPVTKSVVAALTAVSIILTFFGDVVRIDIKPDHVEYIEQFGYVFFVALLAVGLIGGLSLLACRFFRSSDGERQQVKWIFVGLFSTFFVIILTNVVLPNFMDVSSGVTRLGIYSLALFSSFSAYAIVRHRLFEVRIALARVLAVLLLIEVEMAIYGLGLYGFAAFFFAGRFSSLSTLVSNGEALLFFLFAALLSFTILPLVPLFNRFTEGIFLPKTYDSQEVLAVAGDILARASSLEPMINKTLAHVCHNLGIANAEYIALNSSDDAYKRIYWGCYPKEEISTAELERLKRGTTVAAELDSGRRKGIMEKYGISVSLSVRTGEGPVGYLLLGDKNGGHPYTSRDIRLLEILCNQLGLAVTRTRTFEEIEHFNLTLRKRVDQGTKSLQEANRQLRVLDRAKDEFIFMASHQLGTPITAITGFLSIAFDSDKDNMTAKQRECVANALEASERVNIMANDLLSAARITAGRFDMERKPADLAAVVSEEVENCRPVAERKGLSLVYEPPAGGKAPVEIDNQKTRQAIFNLIDNAIKYTTKGGVTVRLSVEESLVWFEVIDSGIGVPEKERASLFDQFYRAFNAKELRPDGTGLGLYLSKRIVEGQGGEVVMKSEPGKGSTFGFSLPRA